MSGAVPMSGQEAGVLPPEARAELAEAMALLRRGRGLFVRLADMAAAAVSAAGVVAMRALTRLPGEQSLAPKVQAAAQAALARAFDVAVLGLRPGATSGRLARLFSRSAVGVSGAVGGFIGLPGLLPDVSFTTLAILRGVARIAVREGEDLSSEEARAACLAVFSLLPAPGEWSDARMDESELSYFSARMLLQGRTMVSLVEQVGARYGLVLSRKIALQAVPIVGAATGAALNDAFLRHALDLAEGHFVIRRLERTYGSKAVREAADAATAAA
ncbi:MAG TPA: EcsC family protein [Acetobacteraceae bacterium]|nr:EcsC family protein [Acetobacteraceae bacterium]